jgi:hypothetical protein
LDYLVSIIRREKARLLYLLCLPWCHVDANEVQVLIVKRFIFLPVLSLLASAPLFAAHLLLLLIFILVDNEAMSFLQGVSTAARHLH